MEGFVNFLGTGSDNFTGGIETYYKNRLKKISEYIFFTKENSKDFDKSNFLTKIYLRFFRRRIKNIFLRNHFDWYFQLYSAMKKKLENLEIVEVPDIFGYGIIPAILKIPFVVKIHTPHSSVYELNVWKKDIYYRIIKKIEKIALKKAVKIISPSKAMIDFLLCNGWKMDLTKVFILNNVFYEKINLNQEKINKKKQILFVGNLEPRKNLFFVLRNFIKNELFNNYSITICGADSFVYEKKTGKNISYWEYCCNKLPEIKNNPRIIYKGFVNNDEIQAFYKSAEFLIISSHCFENFPTVVLEAFQNGVVVIASKTGGIPEMIQNEKNGFLFEDNSDVDFINAFKKAVNCDLEVIKEEAVYKLSEINKQIEVPYEENC